MRVGVSVGTPPIGVGVLVGVGVGVAVKQIRMGVGVGVDSWRRTIRLSAGRAVYVAAERACNKATMMTKAPRVIQIATLASRRNRP
jgi:hypothetical protein